MLRDEEFLRLSRKMSSLSILPYDLQLQVMSNLTYFEISNYCQTEHYLTNLCHDPAFWRYLIHHRYPEYSHYPEINIDPKNLFRRLETSMHITILNKQNYPLRYLTNDEEVMAGAVIGFILATRSLILAFEGGWPSGDYPSIKITDPTGLPLNLEELQELLFEYLSPDQSIDAIRSIGRKEGRRLDRIIAHPGDSILLVDAPTGLLVTAVEVIRHLGSKPEILAYRLTREGNIIEESIDLSYV